MLKASVLIPTVVCLASVLSPALAKAGEVFSKEGVAINGYDAVAYFTEGGPVKGASAFSAPYKGAIFHFSTAANREAFLRDPVRYVPQYGGYCAYGTAKGYKAPTEPQAFSIVDGKLYLNYNDDIKALWSKDTKGYIQKADENWGEVKVQAEP
ncbi:MULTISPECIES: YHS domain-containing (seleno)protein [unclassified Shinella]|uniref:YHS domain-containing (seleno)protein n=1 Tax=unclassified Shinella TaxID=2643062 RepID=UPI00234F187F|nr:MULTISPECIES: YHS domain-containing (seleno)protein [unclassified Shinella]MCO5151602.1 YHS domain-containing protein [Shinella sp.]MDC7266391.1 YHS domain-containing protein [Shinella sp. HY16]MDC7273288.1 YHS domain-containing protein [Shinella sp. YZ44]